MKDFLEDKKRVKQTFVIFKIIWYLILLVLATIYVLRSDKSIFDFTFFSNFNGHHLIFIGWIILLVLPIFNKFEGFGFKVNGLDLESLTQTKDEIISETSSNQSESALADIRREYERVTKK